MRWLDRLAFPAHPPFPGHVVSHGIVYLAQPTSPTRACVLDRPLVGLRYQGRSEWASASRRNAERPPRTARHRQPETHLARDPPHEPIAPSRANPRPTPCVACHL